jgi:uncharacterized repeat protein (TIGR03803 family)
MNASRRWRSSIAAFAICIASAIAAPAQTFNTLATNVDSYGPLLQGPDGNLYAADSAGNSIVKITLEGTVSTVHKFGDVQGGGNPTGLAIGLNGLLYGTTYYGGTQGAPCPFPNEGCGTVFEITAAGTLSTLHRFTGPDGMFPAGGLTLGPDGNFYGTTYGTNKSGATGAIWGTVFQITPSGTLTTLHTFSYTDGGYPTSPLVLGLDGRLYGTTSVGGTANGGSGTVFAVTTGGTFTSLYTFNTAGGPDNPIGALVYGANGNFYGVTVYGGTPDCDNTNNGTIYYVSPGGHQFEEIFDFGKKICGHGSNPRSGLVLASDGNFYGAASGSGLSDLTDDAILFEITPKLDFTTLYTFGYAASPYGVAGFSGVNLMQHTNGTLYGTIYPIIPPDNNPAPSVFSLSHDLPAFITTVPQMRPIGQKVLIFGQGFTGATSVTFNGISATFTINSDTEISATVPKGATKGTVTVTTPTGTLSTTVPFYIG